MLTEYYFKIQHTKGTENTRVDALSRKVELQNNKKPLGAILRKDKDRLIRYNHPKLAAIVKKDLNKSIRRQKASSYKGFKKHRIRI